MKMSNPFARRTLSLCRPDPRNKLKAYPGFPFELPDDVIKRIEAAVQQRIPKIKLYADCEFNSFDHVMLAAMPVAEDAVHSVILDDEEVLERLSKVKTSGRGNPHWFNRWFQPIDADQVCSSGRRMVYQDTLVKHYAERMVRHYRPEESYGG